MCSNTVLAWSLPSMTGVVQALSYQTSVRHILYMRTDVHILSWPQKSDLNGLFAKFEFVWIHFGFSISKFYY